MSGPSALFGLSFVLLIFSLMVYVLGPTDYFVEFCEELDDDSVDCSAGVTLNSFALYESPDTDSEPLPLIFVAIAIFLGLIAVMLRELPALDVYSDYGSWVGLFSALFSILSVAKLYQLMNDFNIEWIEWVEYNNNRVGRTVIEEVSILQFTFGTWLIVGSAFLSLLGAVQGIINKSNDDKYW